MPNLVQNRSARRVTASPVMIGLLVFVCIAAGCGSDPAQDVDADVTSSDVTSSDVSTSDVSTVDTQVSDTATDCGDAQCVEDTGCYGEVSIGPDTVYFGPVAPGGEVSEQVFLQNIGCAPLTINDIQVVPSDDFELREITVPLLMQPADFIEFEVWYTAGEQPPSATTVLVVASDDPETPRFEVPVTVAAP